MRKSNVRIGDQLGRQTEMGVQADAVEPGESETGSADGALGSAAAAPSEPEFGSRFNWKVTRRVVEVLEGAFEVDLLAVDKLGGLRADRGVNTLDHARCDRTKGQTRGDRPR